MFPRFSGDSIERIARYGRREFGDRSVGRWLEVVGSGGGWGVDVGDEQIENFRTFSKVPKSHGMVGNG